MKTEVAIKDLENTLDIIQERRDAKMKQSENLKIEIGAINETIEDICKLIMFWEKTQSPLKEETFR